MGVPRESYFIGSKVGRYELDTERMFDFSAEKTAAGVDSTLARLELDYVDIIQVSSTDSCLRKAVNRAITKKNFASKLPRIN